MDCREDMTVMAGKPQHHESVVIRSLRQFKDRYFPNASRAVNDRTADPDITDDDDESPGFLDSLPVNLHFQVMTLLSPADLCRLGAASRYWRAAVRDPLLWRYFLLRDMPDWPSVDHVTMPHLEALHAPLCDGEEETEGERQEPPHDFMADYLRGCPSCRLRCCPARQPYGAVTPLLKPYGAVTALLQSLAPPTEPRYAMLGPGMDQLDVSLVTRLMHAPDVLPVSPGTPQRQIHGIGSGISFMFKNQHRFNILTLYSTNRAERERARVDRQSVTNKLFVQEGVDQSGRPVFSPAPQLQEVFLAVDGFIYVANAEPERGDQGDLEGAQIRAVVDRSWGPTSRPLLVLSCVSREEPDPPGTRTGTRTRTRTRTRTPCVDVAHRLGLPLLTNPWMVQDTVAETLSGLMDGLSWLLRCSGVKL